MKKTARTAAAKRTRAKRPTATRAPGKPVRSSRRDGEAQIRWLAHELQVHTEEVTAQNEQLSKAQAEIEDARDRYAELYDFAPVGYVTLDMHGAIYECNFAAAAMLGRPRHFLLRVPLPAFVAKEQRGPLRDFLQHTAGTVDGVGTLDVKLAGQPRRVIRLLTKARPAGAGTRMLFTAMLDVTAQLLLADDQSRELQREQERGRELADEIADRVRAQQRIKSLLERLVTVQEEERRRLARDLHDHLGQQLTALRLAMSMLKHVGGPGIQESLEAADAIAARLDRDVDYLAWSLRPAALDEFGLVAAVQTYVKEWSEHHHVRAEMVTTAVIKRLPADMENHLYRIVQEALNNVAKHARATEACIRLEATAKALHLMVEDNGVGFDTSGGRARPGMGLLGMRERVALIGGSIDIKSSATHGTTISVRVPLPADTSN